MNKDNKAKEALIPQEKLPKAPEQAPSDEKNGFKDAGLLEPTRFGDWEVNGRCSDF